MLNEYLKNLRLRKIERIHDYIQLFFEPDGILNIYNPYKVLKKNTKTEIDTLIGFKVISVEVNARDNLVIYFEKDKVLIIDMRLDSFSGPEGMELILPNKPIVVWQQGD